MTENCTLLEWDTAFFGRRIARYLGSTISAPDWFAAEQWCSRHGIECLYLLLDSNDSESVQIAAENRLVPVDIRMTYHRHSQASDVAGFIRPATPGDRDELVRIAGVSHGDSRFYFDPQFERRLCSELYASWIKRSCDGWSDRVWVAECGSEVAGYLTCHINVGEEGTIGLVAVDSRHRGKGLGAQLVQAALAFFHERRVLSVAVVTQGRNVTSQRLYQANGFRVRTVEMWYHRWFK